MTNGRHAEQAHEGRKGFDVMAKINEDGTPVVVAEITFYGTRQTGAGFLAYGPDHKRIAGTGDPVQGRGFTDALFLAVQALTEAGIVDGFVAVYEPSGLKMALIDLSYSIPYWGDLAWTAAPVYVLDAQALTLAASAR